MKIVRPAVMESPTASGAPNSLVRTVTLWVLATILPNASIVSSGFGSPIR